MWLCAGAVKLHTGGLCSACAAAKLPYSNDAVMSWNAGTSAGSQADAAEARSGGGSGPLAQTAPPVDRPPSSATLQPSSEHEPQPPEEGDDAPVFRSLHEAALRPDEVRRLDLAASPQLRCNNLLCTDVGGPCLCKVSR